MDFDGAFQLPVVLVAGKKTIVFYGFTVKYKISANLVFRLKFGSTFQFPVADLA